MGMFDGIKYIFEIPLSWFKRVDLRVFGDHPGEGIKFDDAPDGSKSVSVDYDVLDRRYGMSQEAGTPIVVGSVASEVEQSAGVLWTAGGENGASLLVLFKGEGDDGIHKLYACRLEISTSGMIRKIEAVQNGGVEIWS